jgi:hypothetical protein
MSKSEKMPVPTLPVKINGRRFLGATDARKVSVMFSKIAENEKTSIKLLANTARAYYDAGNILAAAIRDWNDKAGRLTAKAVADASGFPERRVTLALKIYRRFEHNPGALNGLDLRDALMLIAPPPSAGEDGYNRVDLGGDPGQAQLDFGELFNLPASANRTLQNYRTVGSLVSEIIVVRRTGDGGLVSKRFAHFSEDIPQDPALRLAYKTMSQKTQAAIEDYLAALEQEENAK